MVSAATLISITEDRCVLKLVRRLICDGVKRFIDKLLGILAGFAISAKGSSIPVGVFYPRRVWPNATWIFKLRVFFFLRYLPTNYLQAPPHCAVPGKNVSKSFYKKIDKNPKPIFFSVLFCHVFGPLWRFWPFLCMRI
jgi:hypothetical protein